jgi:hypothetical protein
MAKSRMRPYGSAADAVIHDILVNPTPTKGLFRSFVPTCLSHNSGKKNLGNQIACVDPLVPNE